MRLGHSAGAATFAAFFLCVSSTTAHAQSAEAVIDAEVVVTARKRPEDIQRTPIAITAVSGAAIDSRAIRDLSGIEKLVPSLTFRGNAPISGNPSAAVVFLRGVGQMDFSIFTDPGVGIYVDGVYVARSLGAVLDLTNIERVEVLRGPQGTLFGRNTIGGAINVISRLPGEEFGGDVSAGTGTGNRARLQANVNIPLGDSVFTQFSALLSKRPDGYVRRLQTGEDLGDEDTLGGRAQLLWKPSDTFSALLSVDGTRRREGGSPTVPLDLVGTGYVNLAVSDAARPANASNGSFAYVFNRFSRGHPANPACTSAPDTSRDCFGAAWLTDDPYATNGTYPARADLDIVGTALTLERDVGWGRLKSVSAYRELENHYGKDTDHTPYDLTFITYVDRQRQFSQELQLSGELLSKRLKWLVGAYYFRESGSESFDNHNPVASTLADTHIENDNYAAFGEATFDLTERLHLTGGVRWTSETKRFRTDQFIGYQDPDVIAAAPMYAQLAGQRLVLDNGWQRQRFDKATPRVTLSFDLTKNVFLYTTYSEGFKSGGFDGRYVPGFNPASFRFVLFDQPNRYAPEDLALYEVGAKLATPSRNLRLNLAVFRSDYTDLQVPYAPPGNLGVSYIANAARARIDGAELELAWLPWERLQVSGSASYLDAGYTQIDPARVPTIGIDNQFPVTPKWTLGAAVSYAIPVGSLGTLTPQVDWSYRSRQANDAENRPVSFQPEYDVLNAVVAYNTPDELWKLTAGVTNLTDERYLTSVGSGSSFGVIEGVYARPREWYFSVRRSFGRGR